MRLKGHAELLAAAAELSRGGADLEVVIAGEGPERPALEAEIDRLGLGERATLLGALPRRGVLELLATASLFVLACRIDEYGRHDGIPVALMEAMAAGVPVVSTRLSGIPELVEDGVSGLLAEPGDPGSLAAQIGRVLEDGALAERLVHGAAARIEGEFSLARQCERMHALFVRCRGASRP